MPASPWKAISQPDPDRQYMALASYLPLKRLSGTLRFIRYARSVRRQLAGTSGRSAIP